MLPDGISFEVIRGPLRLRQVDKERMDLTNCFELSQSTSEMELHALEPLFVPWIHTIVTGRATLLQTKEGL